MKKFIRLIALMIVFFLVAGVMVPSAHALERYSGPDRFSTAVGVSQAGWAEGADTVILARGDLFADALAGAPLAYAYDAPILLTKPAEIPPVVTAEILRLGAKKAIILGGAAAISPGVAAQLERMELSVERVSGGNRYETAAAIAALVAPEGAATVFLAFGGNFPDALAAASYAAANHWPILLTEASSIPPETLAALAALESDEVIVVGGAAVIGTGVTSQLPNHLRVTGANRYATAVALADRYAAGQASMYIASGEDVFAGADALAGAALAAKEGTGILLVGKTLPPEVAEYLSANVDSVSILGGEAAISPALAQSIEDALRKQPIYNETEKTYHPTIQEAISAARPGSRIRISGAVAGFVLDKPLTIVGGTVNSAVIPATSGQIGIYVPAGTRGAALEGVKIVGAEGAKIGVEIGSQAELTVTAAEISGFTTGIYLNPGGKLTAADNEIRDAVAGIGSDKADLAAVTGNTFINCTSEGIGLYQPTDAEGAALTDKEAVALADLLREANVFADCVADVQLYGEMPRETGIEGLDNQGKRVGFFDSVEAALAQPAVDTILLSQVVDGFRVSRAVTIIGGVVNSAAIPATSGQIGVYLPAGVTGVTLEGIQIIGAEGAKIGIEMGAGAALTIRDSRIIGFDTGIYLNPGGKLVATGNEISYSLAGIGSEKADLTGEVSGNSFNACLSEGIGLYLPVSGNGAALSQEKAALLISRLLEKNIFNYCRSEVKSYGELPAETGIEGLDEAGKRVAFFETIAAALADPSVKTIILERQVDGFRIDRAVTIRGGVVNAAAVPTTSGLVGVYIPAGVKGVVLDGVAIVGSEGAKIGVETGKNVELTVVDCQISDFTTGIYLNPGSVLTATGNTISNVVAGIGSEKADLTGDVSGNTFEDFESEAIGLYLPLGSHGGSLTEEEAEAFVAALEEANNLEDGDVILYGEFPTELKVVQDSGKNANNKENDRPYFEFEVDGREITITFYNPTDYAFAFSYRVDGEEGVPGDWSETVISKGELKGEKIGPYYNIVNVSKDNPVEVKVTVYREIWVGLRLGAAQDWYLDWVKLQFK